MQEEQLDLKEKVVTPNPRVAFRTIGGEVVIVHTLEETLVRLNPTATVIWENLDGKTVSQLAQLIVDRFEVSEQQALDDTIEFVELLLGRKFVTVS